MKIEALEKKLRSAEVNINIRNDEQHRWIQEIEFHLRDQVDKIERFTENQYNQLILIKSEGSKPMVTEKLIREFKYKSLSERSLTLY